MQPEDLIEGLETSSVARWQRASELADLLRNERFAEFRQERKRRMQLAAILDREVGGGRRRQEDGSGGGDVALLPGTGAGRVSG